MMYGSEVWTDGRPLPPEVRNVPQRQNAHNAEEQDESNHDQQAPAQESRARKQRRSAEVEGSHEKQRRADESPARKPMSTFPDIL
jgi:hypothetical protein